MYRNNLFLAITIALIICKYLNINYRTQIKLNIKEY